MRWINVELSYRLPSDAVTVCLVPKIFREDKPPSEAREYTHKNLAKTAG